MKTPSREKIGVLYYGIRRRFSYANIIAVTVERNTRRGEAHWYGRELTRGVDEADCAPTNGTDTFHAKFATREDAEANFEACARIIREQVETTAAAYKVYDEAQKAARARSQAALEALSTYKPAS